MAYIGKTPVIGNFVKLDSITVVNGQAAYTMQNGGVNFTSYDNVNQFLVSLNGVLQAPTDSFTVSGSTLTFASNLSTGDVIDFVLVLGNSLDIGTPSDNTVSLAKLTATGTKDATTFLRGDNTFASITSGITSAQEFRLAADQAGSGSGGTVLTNWEENDTDYQAISSNWSQSSGIFSCGATGIYTCAWTLVAFGATANDAFDPNIQISTDSGSNYNTRAKCWDYLNTTGQGSSIGNTFMFKVANTSTFRLRFRESQDNDIGTTTTIKGSSTESLTNITFVRLGDI